MNENIKALLEKLSKDEAAVAKLQAIKDPDEAYALVSSIQGGFTKEEFIEAIKSLKDAGEGELSDDEIAAAAGGGSMSTADVILSTIKDTIKAAATAW